MFWFLKQSHASLTTWVPSLGLTWWKERTNCHKFSFDLHGGAWQACTFPTPVNEATERIIYTWEEVWAHHFSFLHFPQAITRWLSPHIRSICKNLIYTVHLLIYFGWPVWPCTVILRFLLDGKCIYSFPLWLIDVLFHRCQAIYLATQLLWT